MNKDLKKILEWRQLSDKIMNEGMDDQWVVFIEEDDKPEEDGDTTKLLAYKVPIDIIPDEEWEYESFRDEVVEGDYESKQIDVEWGEDGKAIEQPEVDFFYIK